MRAKAPLDVDLEDKLLYGLTPMRLAYLVVGLVAGFGLWLRFRRSNPERRRRGAILNSHTIQNALFRSSSTVEQAAVNRKVQGSNPCSGANFCVQVRLTGPKRPSADGLHTFG